MATTFKNAITPAIGIEPTIVYTAASNVKVTVLGISLTNVTENYVTANVIITDPNVTSTFTGNLVSGSPTISNVNTFNDIQNGSSLSGTGIPVNTVINSFNKTAKTITMSNNASSNQTAVTISFSNVQPISAYYTYNVVVPPNQSLRIINGGERLVLGFNNTLSISTNVEGSLDSIVSLVEIV